LKYNSQLIYFRGRLDKVQEDDLDSVGGISRLIQKIGRLIHTKQAILGLGGVCVFKAFIITTKT